MRMLVDRKPRLTALAAFLLVGLTPVMSAAAGFGLTAEGGYGTAKLTSDHGGQPAASAESAQYGFGLVFDSNVSGPDLFNFRLKIGTHFSRYTFPDVTYDVGVPPHPVELTGDAIAFDMTPGFAIWRTPTLRLWAGPQFRLALVFADHPYPVSDGLGFGAGLVVGINYSLSPRWSLALEIGYRHGWYEVRHFPSHGPEQEGYRMGDDRVFSCISLLFRTRGEAFEYEFENRKK